MTSMAEWRTPIGQERMVRAVRQEEIERLGAANGRRAHCKVCGVPIFKGDGARWLRRSWYHRFTFYLCSACDSAARTVQTESSGLVATTLEGLLVSEERRRS